MLAQTSARDKSLRPVSASARAAGEATPAASQLYHRSLEQSSPNGKIATLTRPEIAVTTSPSVPSTMPSLSESRRLLLDSIGRAPQMVFVRPFGNIGDEMIWAGARELLTGHIYREVSVNDISSERGELAVISGGGAWSPAYNEYMPEVLAIAERRFERVVVFPSTFDTSLERVRSALARSRATVFAREPESLTRIAGLCDARLAHDTAFFLTLPPEIPPGSGVLRAFRIDREARPGIDLPTDNLDISDTAESLDEWIETIAGYAEVETNRAHVMIAAARMGKRVGYTSGSYFKVDAIARSCLADYDVRPLPMTSGHVPEKPAKHRGYLLQLGERVTPTAGALDALADVLDEHHEALAAAPIVAAEDGGESCGGWLLVGESDVQVQRGSAELGPPSPTGWLRKDAAMFRPMAFEDAPRTEYADPAVRDTEWALHVADAAVARLLAVPAARFLAAPEPALQMGDSIEFRSARMRRLGDHATLLADRDLLMPDELLALMPELTRPDGSLDDPRARLLLTLVAARGTDWALMEWMNGGLDPLIGGRLAQLEDRNATLSAIEAGGWWRLRGRLAPLLKLFGGRK